MDKKKVLILDDEENFVWMVKTNLEETGSYKVLGLTSAKDILADVRTFKPDVILLDLVMPTIGGLEVCDILNKDPAGRTIPIIVISALGKDVDKLKAFKLGIVDYIVKPLKTEALISVIEKALKHR